MSTPVTSRLRYEVMARDKNTCQYCGRTAPDVKLEIDHLVPSALGGSITMDNLITACEDCNQGKTSTVAPEHIMERARSRTREYENSKHIIQQLEAEQDEYLRHFRTIWTKYTLDGQTLPLPAGWQNALRSYEQRGLSIDRIAEFVPAAMYNDKVKPGRKFAYFCGCCRNHLRDLEKRALELVDERDTFDGAPDPYGGFGSLSALCDEVRHHLGGEAFRDAYRERAVWMEAGEFDPEVMIEVRDFVDEQPGWIANIVGGDLHLRFVGSWGEVVAG